MIVALFTDSKNTEKIFSALKKNRGFSLEVHHTNDFKKELKKLSSGVIVYYDISGFQKSKAAGALQQFLKACSLPFGIIDAQKTVTDIAELFYLGASDYIGGEMAKKGIPVQRFKKVVDYAREKYPEIDVPHPSSDDLKSHYTLSGRNWEGIKSGHEYTFCFMFIELDHQAELKKLFGGNQLNDLTKAFHDYILKTAGQIQGRIWIWQDFGGLVLFPFDGNSCDATLTAFRLILNKHIISIENINFDVLLSYRIVLYLGNTVYESRGDTGKIVSDSINTIFHIGQRFAEPGNFYLTKKVFELAPKGLVKYFLPAGECEGKKMMKMRLPV